VSIHKLDLTDGQALNEFIYSQQPDVILHCAAERRPDVSEQSPEAALALNLEATSTLAKAAKQQGAWVLYISTDYVFDGTTPAYSENDVPNPVNFYGESKLRGEQVLLDISNDFAVLRLPILYGQVETVEESAVLVLLNQLLDTQAQHVDHWAIRSPTSTQDIAVAIEKMMARKLDTQAVKGIYHFSAQQSMTKYQMLLVLGDLLGRETHHLTAVSEPLDSTNRPHDCSLSCQRLTDLWITSQIDFKQGIQASLANSTDALSLVGITLNES